MLSIESLHVSYGSRDVLHGISLQVHSGEVLALIGPNGAGKSTLIRAASGVIPVKQGTVKTNGVDLLKLSPGQRARSLAVVPQAVSLPPAFSAWETVLLGRTPYLNFLGQVSTNDEELARMALAKVDGLELAGRRVGELSGGEQQRVLLARALAQSTPILLLDEPTSNLDLHYQASFMELICSLAKKDNLAVLVAIHDLNLAALYSGRVALLVAGRIQAVGRPSAVITPDNVSAAYHQPVQVISHPLNEEVPFIFPSRKPDRKE